MKPITKERLNRVRLAVEQGLSQDIQSVEYGHYEVSFNGAYFGSAPSLTRAIRLWDQASNGEITPVICPYDDDDRVEVDLDQFEGRADGGSILHYDPRTPYEDTPELPVEEYEFDEDGYKIRRK
jgi:hypothetical protein